MMDYEEENALNIVIKTVNNEVHNISVNNSTSVYNLKDSIRQKTSIDIDRQRLIYRGKVLTDESIISDYNIEDNQIVHMVARPANFREIQQSANNATTSSINNPADMSGIRLSYMPPMPQSSTTPVPVTQNTNAGGSNAASSSNAVNNTDSNGSNANEPTNLESIRQGLLTMHTLLSTVNSVNLSNSSNDVSNRSEIKEEEHLRESKPSVDVSTASRPLDTSVLSSERRFFVGQWLDVKDTVSQWLESTIINIDNEGKRIFIHYNGW
jgi:hypothetical protein